MGTQNQTPGSQSQPDRKSAKRPQQKGQDAGNVPRSEDDVMDQASQEGTREDAAGTQSRKSDA